MRRHILGPLIAVLLAVALSVSGSWISYKPLSVDAGDTSTMIVPATTPRVTNDWTTNQVHAYGNYTEYSQRVYWCVSSGTVTSSLVLTNSPVGTDGDDTRDTGITWRVVRSRRNGIQISTVSTGKFNLGFGNAAVEGKGIYLDSSNPFKAIPPNVPQGAIYSITETGTLGLLIQEW